MPDAEERRRLFEGVAYECQVGRAGDGGLRVLVVGEAIRGRGGVRVPSGEAGQGGRRQDLAAVAALALVTHIYLDWYIFT